MSSLQFSFSDTEMERMDVNERIKELDKGVSTGSQSKMTPSHTAARVCAALLKEVLLGLLQIFNLLFLSYLLFLSDCFSFTQPLLCCCLCPEAKRTDGLCAVSV